MESLDLTREVAEKVLKRAMSPVRAALETHPIKVDDSDHATLTYGQLKELDRDLGVLGVTLANRYREQVEFQTTVGVLASENVRLTTVVEHLAKLAEEYRDQAQHLASELTKTRNPKEEKSFRASNTL